MESNQNRTRTILYWLAIAAAVAKDNHRLQTLIHEVVKSDPFRLRRGPAKEKK